jgi:hypothetical protein
LLSGLFISNLIERLDFKPVASAILFIETNELKVVLAPTFSTSEELKAIYSSYIIYYYR